MTQREAQEAYGKLYHRIDDDDSMCKQRPGDEYWCTLEPGHSGRCVAHGYSVGSLGHRVCAVEEDGRWKDWV